MTAPDRPMMPSRDDPLSAIEENTSGPQRATTPGKDLLTRPAQRLGFTIDATERAEPEQQILLEEARYPAPTVQEIR